MNEEEFEELFGNVPFENIKRIQEYINKNFIPIQKIKDKIEKLKKDETNKYYDMFLEDRDLENTIKVLQELLEK